MSARSVCGPRNSRRNDCLCSDRVNTSAGMLQLGAWAVSRRVSSTRATRVVSSTRSGKCTQWNSSRWDGEALVFVAWEGVRGHVASQHKRAVAVTVMPFSRRSCRGVTTPASFPRCVILSPHNVTHTITVQLLHTRAIGDTSSGVQRKRASGVRGRSRWSKQACGSRGCNKRWIRCSEGRKHDISRNICSWM